ncbi:erythromycin esterase family protein [Hymenobacter sp. H14-R3]|uniref:erythromycin esterase family protein n=1 Tax=Hymenobacter sp. H14-R3 TaxID=3046308 RepID=UPI0024B96938|nr:erythromycin esterase family protein [Hymenobacter sp. H14-R3]MDJ0366069.1 erythromycin esterase family protein [Hymenobacter sp. H14-R3]
MHASCKGLIFWMLLGMLPFEARAQTPAALPLRALRSVAPTDTTFAELEFLRAEIGGARVVFLGEPTHGEGNVLAAKARLLAFLQQRMGFTTLGMESGFFDLYKAQRAIGAGKSVLKNLQSSVFPIWMRTREFQAVVPLVGPDGLRIMGFDPQLTGDYSDDLIDDLEDFLDEAKGAKSINFELLGEATSYLQEHYELPLTQPLAAFEAELDKAEPLLRQAAAAPGAARRNEAVFWQQCLRSLRALARDYATHNPNAKTAATFVAADSNPRDAQMADNLLWYLRQHPTEKVVCWGALPHFANHVETLGSEELRAYRPMGRAVKAALGPNQVYILGTLAGGGTHGLVGTAGQPVPTPAPGTLEASLLALDSPYAFVSLKHDAPGLQLTTYAFDYQPLAGPWSEVVDGFLFLRSVAPPHLAAADSMATAAAPAAKGDSAAAAALASRPPGSLNPAPGRGGATLGRPVAAADVSGLRTVRGVVLDQRRRAPVPYASVQVAGQGRGTVADAQGRFSLPLPGPTALQVSSLGYEVSVVQSPRGSEELTVLMAPATYALDEVRVAAAPLDPVVIMKRIIKNIPTNYEQQDYATEVYAYRRLSNFDTLRYEAETVSRMRVPAGYRHFGGGFLMLEEGPEVQVQQQHILAQRGPRQRRDELGGVQGFTPGTADPVRISPLFVARNLRKFTLKLDSTRQQGNETLYVLSFAARRANLRSTGTYLTGVYQGRLLVRQRDYAVLRYEALWQLDTATFNGVARKNAGRQTRLAQLYSQVFSADRSTHTVDYAKATNGRYYARRSIGQSQRAGRTLNSQQPFYYQTLVEQFLQPLPEAGPAPAPKPKPKSKGEVPVPVEVPYRPEFWAGYQRPGGPLAGATPATAPPVAQP